MYFGQFCACYCMIVAIINVVRMTYLLYILLGRRTRFNTLTFRWSGCFLGLLSVLKEKIDEQSIYGEG